MSVFITKVIKKGSEQPSTNGDLWFRDPRWPAQKKVEEGQNDAMHWLIEVTNGDNYFGYKITASGTLTLKNWKGETIQTLTNPDDEMFEINYNYDEVDLEEGAPGVKFAYFTIEAESEGAITSCAMGYQEMTPSEGDYPSTNFSNSALELVCVAPGITTFTLLAGYTSTTVGFSIFKNLQVLNWVGECNVPWGSNHSLRGRHLEVIQNLKASQAVNETNARLTSESGVSFKVFNIDFTEATQKTDFRNLHRYKGIKHFDPSIFHTGVERISNFMRDQTNAMTTGEVDMSTWTNLKQIGYAFDGARGVKVLKIYIGGVAQDTGWEDWHQWTFRNMSNLKKIVFYGEMPEGMSSIVLTNNRLDAEAIEDVIDQLRDRTEESTGTIDFSGAKGAEEVTQAMIDKATNKNWTVAGLTPVD